jgi:hypothetical protein
MPIALAAVALVTSAMAAPTHAQDRLPLLSTDLTLADFGLETVESIRRGRVSIAYAPEGARLATYFLRGASPRRTARRAPQPPDTSPLDAPPKGERERALWVWNTASILREPGERLPFLEFVAEHGITRVFLYLPAAEGERPAAGYIPFDGTEVGPLLAELRTRGALAYALDGDKDYVLPENHPGVFATVERIVAHNRSVPPEQRFHGVRYDIEPYLVPGFHGPRRDALLSDYVELIAGAKQRAADGLAVAVDVPLWLDALDEETGEPFAATWNDERRPVLEHLMAIVDDIAIMNYRTSVEGPNGALAHAQGELALGREAGIDVFIGVETVRLVDEDLHTFAGPPSVGLPGDSSVRWVVLESLPGGRARVWLVDGEEALSELARRVRGPMIHWRAGRPVRVAADAQSFYDLGADAMRRVTERIVDNLSRHEAFVGLAYHDYLGMRRLLESR